MKDGWEIRLAEYVAEHASRPPEIGVHDCLTFANGAARAMTGKGFADDWIGHYLDERAVLVPRAVLQEVFGYRRLHLALSARLPRVERAVRGAIVGTHRAAYPSLGTRLALGVSVGNALAYVGTDGLAMVKPTEFDYAWGLG